MGRRKTANYKSLDEGGCIVICILSVCISVALERLGAIEGYYSLLFKPVLFVPLFLLVLDEPRLRS